VHASTFGDKSIAFDSYLVVDVLGSADQQACLDKVLNIAGNRGETAPTRQHALKAATALVCEQDQETKSRIHERSRAFAVGTEDGSALDMETTNPHPLNTVKIDFGSPSLQSDGLQLAGSSATTPNERAWVRDRASIMLGSNDPTTVQGAAMALFRLETEILGGLDANLLAAHQSHVVRELSALVAAANPVRFAVALRRLAGDGDRRVQIQLARKLYALHGDATGQAESTIAEILNSLSMDVRHSVRRASIGLDA
jgi:hypothetical protein